MVHLTQPASDFGRSAALESKKAKGANFTVRRSTQEGMGSCVVRGKVVMAESVGGVEKEEERVGEGLARQAGSV